MGKQVTVKGQKKWLPSMTKKGTADIHAIIGRHVSIEVKNKYTGDKPSDDQGKERERVTSAGGVYIIATCVEDFFEWYDRFL